MKLNKNILWITLAVAVIAALAIHTDPTEITQANPALLVAAAATFTASIYTWFLAWNHLMKEPFKKCIKINTKSLMGIFAPMGLGTDLLRAYFSKKEQISGSRAIAASFMVKFWKFLLMFFLMLLAIVLLATRTPEFLQQAPSFIAALLLTMAGAVIVLLFRFKAVAQKLNKLLKRYPMIRFHEELKHQFHELTPRTTATLVTTLAASTLLEVATVYLLFLSIGVNLTMIQIFIFTAVAHSLVLVPLTPQGIGIAEGGGYILLSMTYFALPKGTIGSFLILWNIVRIWVPSAVGLATTIIDKGTKRR